MTRLAETIWRPWLPDNSLQRAYEMLDLSGLVADWSAHWFGYGTLGLAGSWLEADISSNGTMVWSKDASAGLWLGADLRGLIQSRMFGSPPYGNELTKLDKDLLVQAVDGCLRDLSTRLSRYLTLGETGAWCERAMDMRFRMCPVGKSLKIAVSDSTAIAQLKRSVPPPPRSTPLPAKLSEVLSLGDVTIGARIGTCQVALAELRELQPGDVLMLDQAIHEHVAVTVNDAPTSVPCLLAAEQECLNLILQ